ncbi:hypothetical protein IMSAGC001_04090 [Bacteroides acidifaciens]|uniref:Uncharacterized protein n=1 Tax=Bacteroides acidifaciens TaxID=85831 RepID=A0A7J0A8Y9_9BACE|nr:hypothetical protein IMSAGC001_04090 [Bacteroides acidifaciens]
MSFGEPVFIIREVIEVGTFHSGILHTAFLVQAACFVGNGIRPVGTGFISQCSGDEAGVFRVEETVEVGLQTSGDAFGDGVCRVVHTAVRQFTYTRFAGLGDVFCFAVFQNGYVIGVFAEPYRLRGRATAVGTSCREINHVKQIVLHFSACVECVAGIITGGILHFVQYVVVVLIVGLFIFTHAVAVFLMIEQ